MVDQIRHKSRGECDSDPSSSSQGHHTHAPPTSRPHHQADDEPGSTFRPAEVHGASQPTHSDEAPLSSDASHSSATDYSANIYNVMHTLLTHASLDFSQTHADTPGHDAKSVLETLMNSVSEGGGSSSSAVSNDPDLVASGAPSATVDTSKLRVVVMTKLEYHSWRRLTCLNPTPSGIESGAGYVDWLRPMRHALSEIALSTKRLEMRFHTENMKTAIQQQYNLERLTLLSEFFHGRLIDGTLAESKPDSKPAITPMPATLMLAHLTDETAVLAHRLESLQRKAEAGTVPFCGHVLDLGKDSVADAPRRSVLSPPRTSTIADPHTAHANEKSERFGIMDVAKGFTLFGLTADTLKKCSGSGSSGPSALELAHDTWSRCDDHIRGLLQEPQHQPDQDQPVSMFAQWIFASARRAFDEGQVMSIKALLEEARQNQAHSVCECASVSSTRGHASSSHGHGHSSPSSGRPPLVKDTHGSVMKHRRK